MYVDAYDWVMAANVLGMSLYADGGYMATKPYAATSTYIRKMSKYCAGCRFDPDQNRWTRARSTTCIGTSSADTRSGSGRIRGCAQSLAGWLKRTESNKDTVP
jgi:deoxyribodipyrimidine photolyase-related protein